MLGDLIDRTPKNLISKVMFEEKVFDTWHGGRTALIGDGKSRHFTRCHMLDDFTMKYVCTNALPLQLTLACE